MRRETPTSPDAGFAAPSLVVLLAGALTAGLVVGVVLGLLGGVDLVGEPAVISGTATASYRDCPDGAVLGEVTQGDRVFITARDESGEWLQVRSPRQVSGRVWMRSIHVLPDAEVDALPVVSCLVPVEAVTAAPSSTVPDTTTSSTTSTSSTTTTTTITPTTSSTTTSTTAPDTTAPSISNVAATPDQIWEEDSDSITCPPGTPRESTVSAFITDAGGLASVTASWTVPGVGVTSLPMAGAGGAFAIGFGPYLAGTWPDAPLDHDIDVTIRAEDASGNVSTDVVTVTVWSVGECFI